MKLLGRQQQPFYVEPAVFRSWLEYIYSLLNFQFRQYERHLSMRTWALIVTWSDDP